MQYITDVMFWVSNGLLIPVIVGLAILFVVSILLLGGFFGLRQRYRFQVKKYESLFRIIKHEGLTPLRSTLLEAHESTPFEKVALHLFGASESERNFLISSYELSLERSLSTVKLLTKFGPTLGLMGTLIPMGPALVALSTGDMASMAYNMQVAFATTVLGMFVAGVGHFLLQARRAYNQKDLIWLDFLNDTLSDEQK